jgi:DNA-binding transcriptional LysR family regulator
MDGVRSVLDLDLLRSFVSVIDMGGFTRASERVHRTQSTVSQQIRRLEESFGRPLLHRDGKHIRPTEEGERLLSYARRLLALAEEARDVVSRPTGDSVVRLGLPEDFAAYRLTEMLSDFCPLASGHAAPRALRKERSTAPRARTPRSRPRAVEMRYG